MTSMIMAVDKVWVFGSVYDGDDQRHLLGVDIITRFKLFGVIGWLVMTSSSGERSLTFIVL